MKMADCGSCKEKENCLYFQMKEIYDEEDPKKLAKLTSKDMSEGAEKAFQEMKKDPYWMRLIGLKR